MSTTNISGTAAIDHVIANGGEFTSGVNGPALIRSAQQYVPIGLTSKEYFALALACLNQAGATYRVMIATIDEALLTDLSYVISGE